MRDPKDLIVVMSVGELRAVVREEVSAALAKTSAAQPSDVLSCEQAAALIGVHPRTVARLVQTAGLPTMRKVGKLWRFNRRDVMAWLAERRSA